MFNSFTLKTNCPKWGQVNLLFFVVTNFVFQFHCFSHLRSWFFSLTSFLDRRRLIIYDLVPRGVSNSFFVGTQHGESVRLLRNWMRSVSSGLRSYLIGALPCINNFLAVFFLYVCVSRVLGRNILWSTFSPLNECSIFFVSFFFPATLIIFPPFRPDPKKKTNSRRQRTQTSGKRTSSVTTAAVYTECITTAAATGADDDQHGLGSGFARRIGLFSQSHSPTSPGSC